jgi:uncharacterized protein (TIGR03083 family)
VRAVRASHDRLADLVAGMDADQLRKQSYDTEWSIADVLSHLGSGAEIFDRFIAAGATGGAPPSPEEFQPIWATWNARSPEEQASESITANEALVTRVESLTPAERAAFSVLMFGQMSLDLAGVLSMRLSEHAVHSWDIAVALDPAARVAPDAVELLIDNMPAMAGYVGQQAAAAVTVAVATDGPKRSFILDTGVVSLRPASPDDMATASLALSAEALLRLLGGRLDDPAEITASGVTLPELKAVFRGF